MKYAAELDEHERGVLRGEPEATSLVPDPQGGDAHLVGGTHVHAIHLPVSRDRIEVDDAWQEDRRKPAGLHQLDHRPEAADALGLVPVLRPDEDGQIELAPVERGDGDQGQSVPGGRRDQVEGERRLQPVDQRRRSPARVVRADRRLQEHLAVGEAAEIEALRPGVDADDSGHREAGSGRGQLARATR